MKRTSMKRRRIGLIVSLVVLSAVVLFALLIATFAPFHIIKCYPSHRGKVVDAGTGEPIEGAVAVGSWNKLYPTVGSDYSAF
jgi:hypothetical protein